ASTTSTAHSSGAHKTTHKSSKASARQNTSSRGKKGSRNLRSSRKRGQQVIDPERARAIQEALIREHYLDGEPSGRWDSATQAAMQRYQADQGWQSKTTPDSRALIKLGLGPSKDHLLNPESAMTTADPKPQAQQPSPTASTPPQ
ncbi:MAG: peptidoglycan-binding domain-containing protein, partial [Terriglobales bacterium]